MIGIPEVTEQEKSIVEIWSMDITASHNPMKIREKIGVNDPDEICKIITELVEKEVIEIGSIEKQTGDEYLFTEFNSSDIERDDTLLWLTHVGIDVLRNHTQ